jgi:hypothetical protein
VAFELAVEFKMVSGINPEAAALILKKIRHKDCILFGIVKGMKKSVLHRRGALYENL